MLQWVTWGLLLLIPATPLSAHWQVCTITVSPAVRGQLPLTTAIGVNGEQAHTVLPHLQALCHSQQCYQLPSSPAARSKSVAEEKSHVCWFSPCRAFTPWARDVDFATTGGCLTPSRMRMSFTSPNLPTSPWHPPQAVCCFVNIKVSIGSR